MDHTKDFGARIRTVQPTVLVSVTAATTAVTGVVVAATGLQTIDLRFADPLLELAPWGMLASGLLALALGSQIYRLRPWAAKSAGALMGTLTISMSGWLLFSMAHGILSLFALTAPPATLLSTVLATLSIRDCKRAATARRELARSGYELGM